MAEYEELARHAVAALRVANQPHWAKIAGVIVSGVVGLLQCGLIFYGLKRIEKTGNERTTQLNQQHEESMLALRTLIERTVPK